MAKAEISWKRVNPSVMVGLALFVITLGLYLPSVQHEFVVVDDDQYVYDNPGVTGGVGWAGLRWAFTSTHASNWHPLTWLSHQVDYSLHGSFSGGHHLTSVILHALNTLLLFLALRRMTGTLWPAALVAALFGWHPLRVESVAWVAERKDVLSTLFWMLTLLAYTRYAGRPPVQGLKSKVLYALALAWFALGLMSKPMVVTLPFVLLLLDCWPLGRFTADGSWHERWRLVGEKIPFFILSAADGVVTVVAQHSGGAIKSFDEVPFSLRAMNSVVSLVRYVWNSICPLNLAVFYPLLLTISPLMAVGAALAVVGVCGLVYRLRYKQPWLVVGWLWYLVTLLPVIGIIQVGRHAGADRYTYIPMIGLFIMAVWSANEWFVRRPALRPTVLAAAGGVLILCLVATRGQLAYWRDSIALFSHTLAVTKENIFAENSLGAALANAGRRNEAIVHFRAALQIQPDYVLARYNLGNELAGAGQFAEAAIQYGEALRLDPKSEKAHNNLGVVLAQEGKLDLAMEHFDQAIRLNPVFPNPYLNLAMALQRQGKLAGAVTNYLAALKLEPNWPEAAEKFALLLATSPDTSLRNPAEAVRLAERASDLTFGRSASCLETLATTYAAAGRFPDAIVTLEKARQVAEANHLASLTRKLDQQLEDYKAGRVSRSNGEDNIRGKVQP